MVTHSPGARRYRQAHRAYARRAHPDRRRGERRETAPDALVVVVLLMLGGDPRRATLRRHGRRPRARGARDRIGVASRFYRSLTPAPAISPIAEHRRAGAGHRGVHRAVPVRAVRSGVTTGRCQAPHMIWAVRAHVSSLPGLTPVAAVPVHAGRCSSQLQARRYPGHSAARGCCVLRHGGGAQNGQSMRQRGNASATVDPELSSRSVSAIWWSMGDPGAAIARAPGSAVVVTRTRRASDYLGNRDRRSASTHHRS